MPGKKHNSKNVKAENNVVPGTPAVPGNPVKKLPGSKPFAGQTTVALSSGTHFIIAAAIGIITWLFLKAGIDNLVTHWDDDGYIANNLLIRDLSPAGISNMFSISNHVMGNYHPLTILSYAIEYSKAGLDPFIYHLDNLLLHILNTLLIYWFVNLLTRRPVAAAIAALLFGLHPMHVESVAWLAGRKDVLYGMFYIAACIGQVYYIRDGGAKKRAWYFGTLLLFICALLSKPVAVVLPLSLLLIDYFEGRELNKFSLAWKEKIPHFIISIAFGLIAIHNQDKFHALYVKDLQYSFIERIALGSYALITYLWKAAVPAHLCCFYQYPPKDNGTISYVYYIYPLIVAALVFLCWKFFRTYRFVVFGLLFFVFNVMLLLQFIPAGGAIIADRYTYMAYTGLFLIVGWLASDYFQPGGNRQRGYIVVAGLAIYLCSIGYLANSRTKVWYNNCTLWRDEIEKQPFASANEYSNLAFYYFNQFTTTTNPVEKKSAYDSAYYLINVALKIQPDFVNGYIGLADLEQNNNQPEEAKKNFLKAISLKGEQFYFFAYQKLAVIYAMSHSYDSSAYFFRAAIAQDPKVPMLHTNYGKLLGEMGQTDSSLKEFTIALSLEKNNYAPYFERAVVLMRASRFPQALDDLNEAIKLSPQTGAIYFYRSICYGQVGNNTLSQQDAQKAKSLGYGQNQ